MSIENDLGRIANAVERLVALAERQPSVNVPSVFGVTPIPVTTASINVEPNYTAKRLAEATTAAAAEVVAKRRGRPPKAPVVVEPATTVVEPTAVEAVVETREEVPVDNLFGDEPEAVEEGKAATLDDVRQALSAVVTRKGGGEEGKKAVYEILQRVGKANRLPGSPKDREIGSAAPGALKEEAFQAVIDAAGKA